VQPSWAISVCEGRNGIGRMQVVTDTSVIVPGQLLASTMGWSRVEVMLSDSGQSRADGWQLRVAGIREGWHLSIMCLHVDEACKLAACGANPGSRGM
jgi:hypothetical protein